MPTATNSIPVQRQRRERAVAGELGVDRPLVVLKADDPIPSETVRRRSVVIALGEPQRRSVVGPIELHHMVFVPRHGRKPFELIPLERDGIISLRRDHLGKTVVLVHSGKRLIVGPDDGEHPVLGVVGNLVAIVVDDRLHHASGGVVPPRLFVPGAVDRGHPTHSIICQFGRVVSHVRLGELARGGVVLEGVVSILLAAFTADAGDIAERVLVFGHLTRRLIHPQQAPDRVVAVGPVVLGCVGVSDESVIRRPAETGPDVADGTLDGSAGIVQAPGHGNVIGSVDADDTRILVVPDAL